VIVLPSVKPPRFALDHLHRLYASRDRALAAVEASYRNRINVAVEAEQQETTHDK
jgi:hypothetical protein